MSRRTASIAALTAAVLLVPTLPAAAIGVFGSPEVLVSGCDGSSADAAIAPDGTSRGFADCAGQIWFFRDTPAAAPARQLTPYAGVVLAAAWDGANSTYVVYQQGSTLQIGKRVESTGTYAPPSTLATGGGAVPFTADVVAAGSQWWAVWSEQVGPGGEFAQTELFQRHTLLGTQGRTRITSTTDADDTEPTLAYAGGRVTMVWTRATAPEVPGPSDLRIAESTGGSWLSRSFASLGSQNHTADVTVYAGITWVTWGRDGYVVVADNTGGTFHSRTFGNPGFRSTVAVSGTTVFVAWTTAGRAFLAERSGGVWTSGQVAGQPTMALRVLAQGTKARVIYETATEVVIRTQT